MIVEPGWIFPLSEFLNALEGARRGVLLLEIEGKNPGATLCTGWLITDRLVVVPRHVVVQPDDSPADRYVCWMDEGIESVGARLVHLPATSNVSGPALLQLDAPQPGRVLRLDRTSPKPGQRIVVPQHPEGNRRTYLSLGRITEVAERWIRYDASTKPGSGGAPALSGDTFGVLGMHVRASRTGEPTYNEAVSLAEILEELRSSASWDEIAQNHQLADVGAAYRMLANTPQARPAYPTVPDSAPVGPDLDLLGAALRWSVDPEELDPDVRARLLPLVGDPDEPRWSLLGDERRRLIKDAFSLATLQKVRGPSAGTDPGQRTIDRILDGPPFDLAAVADEDLPYWLQAVGWFADVVPGLPNPAQVHRFLGRRRLRGRLSAVTGPRLWGREAELDRLRTWYHDGAAGPMAVTGIGGVGKSALIARFALDLPSGTVLLWLDFDRADLAPDDAVSVLRSLTEQLSVQADEPVTVPAVDASAWEESVNRFGAALARVITGDETPLLVLDGFEIAQHVDRHEEIWEVLGRIFASVPELRVIVSGRAPVPGLNLEGRLGETMHLDGLAPGAARAWLLDRGITDPALLTAVLRLTEGVPLLLKMAVRLVETGGDIRTIPQTLSRTLVEGYLYQRILERVVDWELRPLARDALQLRRLSAEMIPDVLGDRVPEGMDADTVFARLSRELALVEAPDTQPTAASTDIDPGTLRLRPEVRAATLRLLELDDVNRVREIDRRAADWYARQDRTNLTVATELVYHRLRLGDIQAAERAWLEGCAQLLLDAEQEIPEAFEPARAWLRDRIAGTDRQSAQWVTAWEQEAYGRIRSALGRDLVRVVPSILGERQDRAPNSVLSVYDAWVRWQLDGDLQGARAALKAAGSAPGPTGRERAVLGALLAAQAGDWVVADSLLVPFDDPAAWTDRTDGTAEALAVRAARVRLTVDLQEEVDLAGMLRGDDITDRLREVLGEVLTSADLVLPSLSRMFQQRPATFRLPPSIPVSPEELDVFARELDAERYRSTGSTLPGVLYLSPTSAPRSGTMKAWTARDLGLEPPISADLLPSSLKSGVRSGLHLAVLAHRRWEIAAHTMFLADALEPLVPGSVIDTLRLAVLCTVTVFHGQPLRYGESDELNDLLRKAVEGGKLSAGPAPFNIRSGAASAAIRHEIPPERLDFLEGASIVESTQMAPSAWQLFLPSNGWPTDMNALLLYLLGPDPLDVLYRRILGIPGRAAGGS